MPFLAGMCGANEPRQLDRSFWNGLVCVFKNPLRARLGARVSVSNGVAFTLENSLRAQAPVLNSPAVRGATRAS